MHAEALQFAQETLNRLDVGRWVIDGKTHRPQLVVEIGSLNINGSCRPLFEGLNVRYVGIDVAAGPGVDVVADGATYEPESPPALVICMEVLEHARNAGAVVRNALKMLAPGGVLLVTCASDPRAPHSGVDGGDLHPGEWYQNVGLEHLATWLDGAEVLSLEWQPQGDLQALAVKR